MESILINDAMQEAHNIGEIITVLAHGEGDEFTLLTRHEISFEKDLISLIRLIKNPANCQGNHRIVKIGFILKNHMWIQTRSISTKCC